MVSVFTDGSAVAKPDHPFYGHGGMAAVFVLDGKVTQIIHRGYRNTKTGRMELRAALTALQVTSKDQALTVYSDSKYVVNTFMEGWITRWELDGWPCKNVDLMKLLLSEYRKFRPGTVKFRHVKGHSGNRYNELADQYASYRNFTEFELDLPDGFGGEYIMGVSHSANTESNKSVVVGDSYWYYHENSDNFFIHEKNEDWGNDTEFVWEIGIAKEGTIVELKYLLRNTGHYLMDHPELDRMISLNANIK